MVILFRVKGGSGGDKEYLWGVKEFLWGVKELKGVIARYAR